MSRPFLGRTARLTVRLPPADAKWLAAEAVRQGRLVNDLVVDMVHDAVKAGRVPGIVEKDARLAALDDESAGR